MKNLRKIVKLTGLTAALFALALFSGYDCKPRHKTPPPRRVVLMVIDTLRADHVGAYGYGRATSPNMDSIASRGILFKRTVAGSSWTQPSMASLMTSTYPRVHHVNSAPAGKASAAVLPSRLVTMAEFLKQRGFETKAVSSQPLCNALTGFDQGFDDFESVFEALLDERETEKVMDRALAWLESRSPDSSFFLYIHVMGPHFPYIPPPGYKGRFGSEGSRKIEAMFHGMDYKEQMEYLMSDEAAKRFSASPDLLAELVALYDEEIAYVDDQVKRLWDALEGRGMIDETMFILTSDHGEGFLDHGLFTHGNALYRELVEVPMIIHYPPLGKSLSIDGVVSHLDVLPTLADLFGERAPYPSQGESLIPLAMGKADRTPALSELYLRAMAKITDRDYSLIYRPKSRFQVKGQTFTNEEETTLLFDLAKDPGETRDLSETEVERAAALKTELLEMEEENARIKIPAADSIQYDPKHVEQLKAVGYLH